MAQPESRDIAFELKERAMDEAPVGITISDPDQPDNPLIYVNEAFEQLTGFHREDVLGRNCRFLQGEDTDQTVVTEIRNAIDAADPVKVELLNYRNNGDPFWNEVTIAPVRNQDGEVTNFVGFQMDVTERKHAQMELASERAQLDRLIDRINGLLADVTELLMHGVDREATERALVDRIAATDSYAAAWIGEPDLAQEILTTSSAAGFDQSVDSLTIDINSDSPAARAFRDSSPKLDSADESSPFMTDEQRGPIAAVPLVYGDAIYGVLVVRGVESNALDDRELTVLESVGRTIATAINAAQSRRGLTTDDLIELEFIISDAEFFPVALSNHFNCHVELKGSAASGGTGLRLFVDVTENITHDDSTVADNDEIASINAITREDGSLLELQLAPGSVIDRLAERGASVLSLIAAEGTAEIEISVPAETGGRVVLELLEDRYEGVELIAYRERERRPTTKSAFVEDLEDQLTDRQRTALRSAFYSGYYDEPRTVSGDELAEAMGVSRPTFHQHLRTAERKLLGAVFEGSGEVLTS